MSTFNYECRGPDMTSQVIDQPQSRAQGSPHDLEQRAEPRKDDDMPDLDSTPSYAVGLLTNVVMGDEIVEYLRRIDATLAPYGGRFLIHGASPAETEGRWPGDLIVIEFPDADGAASWYASDPYQAIIPLRSNTADASVAVFSGVPQPHRATDILTESTHG